ncbi:MAG TPA: hypothetical protein VHG35_01290 [Gemmatimonadales bacterium]|nr:hypothetical protein [Gemmatimonadales bacterium]
MWSGRIAAAGQVLGLIGLLLGCASRSEEDASEAPPSPATAEVALEVENHGWSDIIIYLVRGTSTDRLGMVGSLSTETFIFPYRELGAGTDVRLRAYPIGGPRSYTSESLLVQPGQWVKWTLESDLTRSFLAVY